MERQFIIFHGSKNVIEKPVYGYGNTKNDYGQAFYCTANEELAKEWACQEQEDGFANKYCLNLEGLRILDLDGGDYHILNWLAILLQNRTFRMNSDLLKNSAKYVEDNFLPQYENYDVIIGYRADDSYFSFASAFLNNTISLERLEKAMYLGTLGEQIAVKSQKAFERLTFIDAQRADRTEYYPKRMFRDGKARNDFMNERQSLAEGTYIMDIMRQHWRNDDERLQRIVLR